MIIYKIVRYEQWEDGYEVLFSKREDALKYLEEWYQESLEDHKEYSMEDSLESKLKYTRESREFDDSGRIISFSKDEYGESYSLKQEAIK